MRKTALLVCCTILLFSGCQGAASSTDPQKQLLEMKGYEAEAVVTRKTDHGENSYTTMQYFDMEDGKYRLEMVEPEEVKGNFTVYDGEKVYQFNPRTGTDMAVEVTPDQARNELFLGQFVKNYLQSEGVSMANATVGQRDCIVLEAVIPGDFAYTATEKLWLDTETGLPVKLVIYDNQGQERYVTEYEAFQYTDSFPEGIFTPEYGEKTGDGKNGTIRKNYSRN